LSDNKVLITKKRNNNFSNIRFLILERI